MMSVDATGATVVPSGRAHVVRALVAAMWAYGGRGTGLLWTLALTSQLGIGSYGQYAMAYAAGAIVSAPMDNPFAVRAIRESENRFVRERSLRVIIAATMIVAGIAMFPVAYIVWFGLIASGGEMIFSALKSRRLRDGHPDVVQRWDTTRQVSSVALGTAYLFSVPDPSLTVATLLFCLPYVAVAVMAIKTVWGTRPAFPGPPRIAAVLFGENLAVALYLQGDILLLGFLTDSAVVGYYSIVVLVAWALAQVGAALGSSYHEKLRDGAGVVSSGPPIRHTLLLAAAAATIVLVIGVGILLSPLATELGVAMIIMSVFVFIRVINFVYTVILSMQRRDLVRSGASALVVPIKLGLVAALVAIGAIGAAIASVLADAILLAIFSYILARPVTTVVDAPGDAPGRHRKPDPHMPVSGTTEKDDR